MYDSLLYNISVLPVSDTSIVISAVDDSSTFTKLEQGSFLELGNVQINPILQTVNISDDIITYVIISLIGIISIIWFLLPERFLTIFSFKSMKQIQRDVDSASKAPGLLITGIFWVTFIASSSIFIFLTFSKFFRNTFAEITDYQIIKYILLVIISLFLYRFALTYTTAFIFQTEKMMKQQVIIDRNIQLITGILLLPIILLLQYVSGDILIFIVIGSIALLQAYRIAQIVIIGNSSSVFSALHIILYLCALEIVPLLVLLRLINNDSGI